MVEKAAAAHARQEGAAGVAYASELLSVPLLLKEVTRRLGTEHLEAAGVDNPSEQWVRLQFHPKDSRTAAALNYTGRRVL